MYMDPEGGLPAPLLLPADHVRRGLAHGAGARPRGTGVAGRVRRRLGRLDLPGAGPAPTGANSAIRGRYLVDGEMRDLVRENLDDLRGQGILGWFDVTFFVVGGIRPGRRALARDDPARTGAEPQGPRPEALRGALSARVRPWRTRCWRSPRRCPARCSRSRRSACPPGTGCRGRCTPPRSSRSRRR